MNNLSSAPWAQNVTTVLEHLESDPEKGLSPETIVRKKKIYGPNVLSREKSRSQWVLFLRQFINPMVYLLGAAAVFSLIFGEYLNGAAISAILFLNAVIGYIQESKAQTAIEALKNLTVPHTRVLRSGKVHTISSEELLPGDILHLEAGDLIPADSRVLKGFQLTADESTLTGESLPVEKAQGQLEPDTPLAERSNMLHAGSAITAGSGRAVVTNTGMYTEIGQIAGMLNKTSDEVTPLQRRLEGMGKRLIVICLIVIAIVFALRLREGLPLITIMMDAISLAVAGIPEGLPTVVTLALAIAVRRMVKRNAIVRNLAAVETLGSTTVICTDKTGTLTTGRMEVRNIYLPDTSKKEVFLQNLVLCNNASLSEGGSGDTTELALLKYAKSINPDISELRKSFPREHEWSFESDRKRMSVAVKNKDKILILTKGAPESMLPLCDLSAAEHEEVSRQIQNYSEQGQRLLAFAYKDVSGLPSPEDAEKNLSFLGLVALSDPPKKESMMAVKDCQEAGIKVVMITGDHPVTARAIALELGIIRPGIFEGVLTGKELESMDKDLFKERALSTAVYARVSPAHKMRIIEALQSHQEIVAMTGDGVNDAPALKKAEIGVAMGKAGTEVARQAANMILTDDNFSTIVRAVEEGRAIYGNIRRTIQYQLSTNMAEMLMVLGASVLALPVPFTPIGLLWINLVTDGLPSLALAAEPLPPEGLKGTAPSPGTFMDRKFLQEMFLMGLTMTALSLGLYYYELDHAGPDIARSYAFTMLIYLSLFRSFSCRSDVKSYFQLPLNGYHLTSVLIPFLLQIFLQHTKLYQRLLAIVPLSWKDLLFVAFVASVPITVIEMMKIVKNRSWNS
jgi:Ca2+-transporting ATPase